MRLHIKVYLTSDSLADRIPTSLTSPFTTSTCTESSATFKHTHWSPRHSDIGLVNKLPLLVSSCNPGIETLLSKADPIYKVFTKLCNAQKHLKTMAKCSYWVPKWAEQCLRQNRKYSFGALVSVMYFTWIESSEPFSNLCVWYMILYTFLRCPSV